MTELLHRLDTSHMLIYDSTAFPNVIPRPTYSILLHRKGVTQSSYLHVLYLFPCASASEGRIGITWCERRSVLYRCVPLMKSQSCNPQASLFLIADLLEGFGSQEGSSFTPNVVCQLRPSDHSGSVQIRSAKNWLNVRKTHTPSRTGRAEQSSVLDAAAKSSGIWRWSKQKSINKPCDQLIVTRDTFSCWSCTHVELINKKAAKSPAPHKGEASRSVLHLCLFESAIWRRIAIPN